MLITIINALMLLTSCKIIRFMNNDVNSINIKTILFSLAHSE